MTAEKPAIWSLYIVETARGVWYTGITTNVNARLETHQSGRGAKSLRGKGPLKLIYQQVVGDRSAASRLEYQVKQLTKVQKRKFVQGVVTISSTSADTE
ncbi:FIG137864: putative endonuclease containing a URI domain [Pseudoalteromonas luteoviolacea B = ATCC 29581]|nr:FIG137864: putative endonuclease containing a URI domain [Pseudoalteromonas luteoviolacea B = ATCC 29581]